MLAIKYPLNGLGQHDEALVRRARQASRIVEAVVHRLHDFVLLKQHRDRFGLVDPCLALI